jgi:DnaA family protein
LDQLPLPLTLPTTGGFDSFVVDGNVEAVTAIKRWAEGDGDDYLYLHGAAGSGKSHLLQSACLRAAKRGGSTSYLPLDRDGLVPAVLDDLDQRDVVVIDALQTIAGDPAWERPLFGLYNDLKDAGRRLLIGARVPPPALGLGLSDLTSRLCAGPAYALRPLDDAGRAQLLANGAEQRGLRLDQAAVSYILTRCPRDAASLLGLLDDLDRLSLARQRPLNVRLIGELLAERAVQ